MPIEYVTSELYKLAYENGIHKLADEFHTPQSTSIKLLLLNLI